MSKGVVLFRRRQVTVCHWKSEVPSCQINPPVLYWDTKEGASAMDFKQVQYCLITLSHTMIMNRGWLNTICLIRKKDKRFPLYKNQSVSRSLATSLSFCTASQNYVIWQNCFSPWDNEISEEFCIPKKVSSVQKKDHYSISPQREHPESNQTKSLVA